MRILKHILIVITSLFLILGVPFLRSDYFAAQIGGSDADAVSSASLILEQPSGAYVVLINRQRHTDTEKLETWIDFFEGREVSYIFEDISCIVAKGDVQGLEMARSFQSRLPEHQMTVRQEDGILLLSKAEAGKYDIIIMSKEAADAYDARTLYRNTDTEFLTVER
ncbi:MAG: hypothetical protein IJ711_03050 [Lachnospiraceae bacterium]|nr:hypothetical protein [Lachnospiraceae bacterium]